MTLLAETPVEPRAPMLGYAPALDGMRAFAIVTVVLTHAPWHGKPILAGGFLGVDVFFVLSGFLITMLLLQEHQRHGRISLRGFYMRRARRLLPLLAVILALAFVVYFVSKPTSQGRPTPRAILAAAFYYANWFRVNNAFDLGFITPTWSLAIEEQFYLVWPVAVIGLLAWRRSPRLIAAVALVAAAASAWWRRVLLVRALAPRPGSFVGFYAGLTGRAPPGSRRALPTEVPYYRTDTRADALLVGCAAAALLVAYGPRLTDRARRLLARAGLVAVPVIVWVFSAPFPYTDFWIDRWGRVVLELAVAFVLVAVIVQSRTWWAKLLALAPLVWIGRRAYGIYLVHIFVFTYLPRHIDVVGGDAGLLIVATTVTLVLVALLYRFVEQPFLASSTRTRGAPVTLRAR